MICATIGRPLLALDHLVHFSDLCRGRRSSHSCTRATFVYGLEKKISAEDIVLFHFNFILKKNGNGSIKPSKYATET
jgi:hypothetical protein